MFQTSPILDSFEKAFDMTSAQAFRSGIELVHKQLVEVMENNGLTPISGREVRPNFHQALSRVESASELVDTIRRVC